MKCCTQCKATKPITEFHASKLSKDGRRPNCKACRAAQAAAYHAANKEKRREVCRAYRESNAERERERVRAWAAANPERAKAATKAWVSQNRDRMRAANRRHYERHHKVLVRKVREKKPPVPRSGAKRAWGGMRQRCLNPRNPDYPHYGGRGIAICERWASFESFLADMGNPAPGESIDRIDNDGNYEPANCRWATRVVQVRNRRLSLNFVYDGQLRHMKEIAALTGHSYQTLRGRIQDGLTLEQALAKPYRKRRT